jgi:hypothetical protein
MALKCRKGTPCGGACIRTGAKCKKEFKPGQSEALDKVKKKIGLGVKIRNAQRKGQATEEARLRLERAALSKGKVPPKSEKSPDAGQIFAKQLQMPLSVPSNLKKELNALANQDQQKKPNDIQAKVEAARAKGRAQAEKEIAERGIDGAMRGMVRKEAAPAKAPKGGAEASASAKTKAARRSAKGFDSDMQNEPLRREGDQAFDKWGETTGSGAKKLGQGSYGTVIKAPDSSYAVKRGDVSDTEAKLVQRLGDRDLGPKLIAADIDGPGYNVAPGVDNRRGRMAMTIVPGTPIGKAKPDKEIGGVKVADAYWKARADLHRMGIAHNDMHIENVLIDKNGKGRFVDMGLAQGMPKAALSEAMGVFDPPAGGVAERQMGAKGQGDWQARRWEGTGGILLGRAGRSGEARKELEKRAPLAHKARDNKTEVMIAMRRDGLTNNDIATIMDHGLRNKPSTYDRGVWGKITDDQAMKYINILYDGV